MSQPEKALRFVPLIFCLCFPDFSLCFVPLLCSLRIYYCFLLLSVAARLELGLAVATFSCFVCEWDMLFGDDPHSPLGGGENESVIWSDWFKIEMKTFR